MREIYSYVIRIYRRDAESLASGVGDPRQVAYALSMLGRALLLQGDLQAAIATCQRILQTDPRHTEAMTLLGVQTPVKRRALPASTPSWSMPISSTPSPPAVGSSSATPRL